MSAEGDTQQGQPPYLQFLQDGNMVVVQNMENLPELNGREGIIQKYIKGRNRWEVRMLGTLPKRLKAENIVPAALASKTIPRQYLHGKMFLLRSVTSGLYLHPSALHGSVLGPARASGHAALGSRLLLHPAAEGPEGWRRLALKADLAKDGGILLASMDTDLPLHPHGPDWEVGSPLAFGNPPGQRVFSWKATAPEGPAGTLDAPFALCLHEDQRLFANPLTMYPYDEEEKKQKSEEGLHAELVLGWNRLYFVAIPVSEELWKPSIERPLPPPENDFFSTGRPFVLQHALSGLFLHVSHPLYSFLEKPCNIVRMSCDRFYDGQMGLVAEPWEQDDPSFLLRSLELGTYIGSAKGWRYGVLALEEEHTAIRFRVSPPDSLGTVAIEAVENGWLLCPDAALAEEGAIAILETPENLSRRNYLSSTRFVVRHLEVEDWISPEVEGPAAMNRKRRYKRPRRKRNPQKKIEDDGSPVSPSAASTTSPASGSGSGGATSASSPQGNVFGDGPDRLSNGSLVSGAASSSSSPAGKARCRTTPPMPLYEPPPLRFTRRVVVRVVDFNEFQLEWWLRVIEESRKIALGGKTEEEQVCDLPHHPSSILPISFHFDATQFQSLEMKPWDAFLEACAGRDLYEGTHFEIFEYSESEILEAYPALKPFLGFRQMPNVDVDNSLAWGMRTEAVNVWFQALDDRDKPDFLWVLEGDCFVAGGLQAWLDLHDASRAPAATADLLASGLDTNTLDYLRSDSMWRDFLSQAFEDRIHPHQMRAVKEYALRFSRRFLDRLHELSLGDEETAITAWSQIAVPTLCCWEGFTWKPLRTSTLSSHFGKMPEVSELFLKQVDDACCHFGTPMALHPCKLWGDSSLAVSLLRGGEVKVGSADPFAKCLSGTTHIFS